jgi:hypothetical protein
MKVTSIEAFERQTENLDLNDHWDYVFYILAHFRLKDKLKLERKSDKEYLSWFPFNKTYKDHATVEGNIQRIKKDVHEIHEGMDSQSVFAHKRILQLEKQMKNLEMTTKRNTKLMEEMNEKMDLILSRLPSK